jgi:hypothetical protein
VSRLSSGERRVGIPGASPESYRTTIVPLMLRPWIVQWYGYVPAVPNVAVKVPDEKLLLLAGAPVTTLNVTLCVTPVGLFHVTEVPGATVIDVGLKLLLVSRQTVVPPGVHAAGVPPPPPPPGAVTIPVPSDPPDPPHEAATIRAAMPR